MALFKGQDVFRLSKTNAWKYLKKDLKSGLKSAFVCKNSDKKKRVMKLCQRYRNILLSGSENLEILCVEKAEGKEFSTVPVWDTDMSDAEK